MTATERQSILTRAQFAAVVRADEKWVENSSRALGRRLEYTSDAARWMGIVRLLARDFGIPVTRAAELADEALRHSPESRVVSLMTADDGAATLVIDLARYHSTFAAALSAAITHGGARRRGRPPSTRRRRRDPVGAAESFGVDLSLLQEAIERTPAERLARLDTNASFLSALRPVPRRTRPRKAS